MNDYCDNQAFDGLPLLPLTSEGEAPKCRLKDPTAGRSIFTRMRDDDLTNSRNRAATQLLLDGEPPYNDRELVEAGQPDTTNLNFGGAEQQLERASAPYYRLVQSDENLVTVSTLFGPEESREQFNAVLSEEISRTIRDSEGFSYQTMRAIQKFIWDGIGVIHWPDEIDWRYRGSGLGQFYFPRQSAATESEFEVVCCTDEYTVTRLWAAIKNEEAASENGWDVPAVKQAIMQATTSNSAYQDWEKITEELKANDLYVSNGVPVTRVVNIWVKEFDGTITHSIFTEDALKVDDRFIYQSHQKYNSMREALVLFPYGLGTNTKLHSIRGLGYKIYPMEQQRNRSIGRLIDQGLLGSSLMMQADNEETMAGVGLQYFGSMAVIAPGMKPLPFSAPDLSKSVMPAISLMDQLRNDRVAGYSSDNVFDGDQRKTKFEVSAQLQQSATLSDSALDFFNAPFERVLQQTVRRIARKTYLPMDPGGREVADLRLRLAKRGVPLEALYQLDVKATKFVRAIGAGSASAKTLSLDRISQLRGRMDDVGQANLDRDLAVDAVGTGKVDRYFPLSMVKRTTEETSIAILQNQWLLASTWIPVLPSDYHMAHAREHIKPLIEGFQAVEEGQIPIEEGAVQMQALFNHTVEHVEAISGDPLSVEEAAGLRQMLQQIGEVISNGLRKAQVAAAKQQQEGIDEGEQQLQGPSDQQVLEVEKHREVLRQTREKADLEMQIEQEKAAQKMRIKDEESAQNMGLKNAQAAVAIARNTP